MATAESNDYTIGDMEAMPHARGRSELIAGRIVITPTPEPVHQEASGRLHARLGQAAPAGHKAFAAPVYVDLPGGHRVVPDLVVAPVGSVGAAAISSPVLLLVEVVAPWSVLNDYTLKRAVYAEAGVPAYWIVDPARHHLLALRLANGDYEPYADTDGHVDLDWPVAVSFDVADLAPP